MPHARVVGSSSAGFAIAMYLSVHSFIRLARLVGPLIKESDCLLTMSCYMAQKKLLISITSWDPQRAH